MLDLSVYVDTGNLSDAEKVIEGKFQERFLALLQSQSSNVWSLAKKFYKVAYSKSYIDPGHNPQQSDEIPVKVAQHYILKNSNISNTYLGIALIGEMSILWGSLSEEERPVNSLNLAENQSFISVIQEKIDELETDTSSSDLKMTKFFNPASVYFYVTDRLPSIIEGGWGLLPWGTTPGSLGYIEGLERACLDVEVWNAYYSAGKFVIREPELNVMQSPITKCILRYSKQPIEDLYSEEYDVVQNDTNWWYDSEVHIKGCIDDYGFFLIVQADNVPAWEDNIVPCIPLYFGRVDVVEDNDSCVAFFGGTMPDVTLNQVAAFDFDDPDRDEFQKYILPILKTYPRHPSNGLDTVMVKRCKYGARYQSYYLAWGATPNIMPPDRENKHVTEFTDSIVRDYPRAWNQHKADEYAYWFNPSQYSKKIHTSKIYIVHPEEGVRGNLRWSVGLSPIGVSNGNKIRVMIDPCGTEQRPVYEYYRYNLIDGVSPLTKRPGTPYRPIGLGIRED